jgi:hypothetical protein
MRLLDWVRESISMSPLYAEVLVRKAGKGRSRFAIIARQNWIGPLPGYEMFATPIRGGYRPYFHPPELRLIISPAENAMEEL